MDHKRHKFHFQAHTTSPSHQMFYLITSPRLSLRPLFHVFNILVPMPARLPHGVVDFGGHGGRDGRKTRDALRVSWPFKKPNNDCLLECSCCGAPAVSSIQAELFLVARVERDRCAHFITPATRHHSAFLLQHRLAHSLLCDPSSLRTLISPYVLRPPTSLETGLTTNSKTE